jgi:hypothetical protein
LRTRKDSGNSFINDNYAFMSLGALNDPQRVVVSPERALSVNRLPCTNSQVRPKSRTLKIFCANLMQRSAAISAIVLSLVCAPAAISQQPAPATSRSNNDVESARSHPLTISVPKPRNATAVDPPSEEDPSFVRVTSDGNQLIIQAKDCALSQILDAVRAKTGANIDVSGGAAEHMTVNIGPGPARQVISSLLGWTDFDYVIQGSDGDSVTIQSIMLFPKTKSTSSPAAGTPALGPHRQPLAGQPSTPPEPVTPPPAPEPPQSESAAPAEPTAEATPPSTTPTPIPTNYERTAANGAAPDPTAGKSTTEMIQDMQQLYEQRKQIQQEHNQTPGAAPLPSH